jgi:hypothetical protein
MNRSVIQLIKSKYPTIEDPMKKHLTTCVQALVCVDDNNVD